MTASPIGKDLPLRDIHAPPTPELWPPAPGWWVLLGLGLALLVLGCWWLYGRYRITQRRRRILDELSRLGEWHTGPALAAEVSALLKRVALARYPRTQVAALTGPRWLELLDSKGGGGRFAAGPGRVLAEGPYAPDADFDAAALLALARDWIRRNG